MLLLGLTGSIATGKSTVSRILQAPPYNLPLIDADVLARDVVRPGTPAYQRIVAAFAPSTPDLLLPASDPACSGANGPEGRGRPLNRAALGRRVFGDDPEATRLRGVLNGIVHPAVGHAVWRAVCAAYVRGHWAVVLDIPLLYEAGWERVCGTVMVVAVTDAETQMGRLQARDAHLTGEEARRRVESQSDVREKARRCVEARGGAASGVVVWNDGDVRDLEGEVRRVMAVVRGASPAWWGWLLWVCPPVALGAAGWCYVRSWVVEGRWKRERARERARL